MLRGLIFPRIVNNRLYGIRRRLKISRLEDKHAGVERKRVADRFSAVCGCRGRFLQNPGARVSSLIHAGKTIEVHLFQIVPRNQVNIRKCVILHGLIINLSRIIHSFAVFRGHSGTRLLIIASGSFLKKIPVGRLAVPENQLFPRAVPLSLFCSLLRPVRRIIRLPRFCLPRRRMIRIVQCRYHAGSDAVHGLPPAAVTSGIPRLLPAARGRKRADTQPGHSSGLSPAHMPLSPGLICIFLHVFVSLVCPPAAHG